MKITLKDFPGFLKTSRACLIYGPDEGAVREQARKCVAAVMGANPDPMNLTELTGAQLKEDPALLADALNSFSLMGGERLVWLREPLDSQIELVQENILSGNPTAYLLVTDGELKPTSKWRSLFEKDKQLSAFACYRDEARQLTQLIGEQFTRRGITADREVLGWLSAHLGNDRGVTLQEIEKIDIFLGEERHLTLDQAMDLCGDNREIAIDDLCHAVCAGQPAQLPSLLARLYEENTQPIGICRILNNHFLRLRQIQLMVAEGIPLEQVFTQLRIFFKAQPRLREQLRRWNDAKISRALEALLEAEKQIKTLPAPPELLCNQLLHRLALGAGR